MRQSNNSATTRQGGSPGTLLEAIAEGLTPLTERSPLVYTVHSHVKDYLSDRFLVAIREAHTIGEETGLRELFERIA